MISSARLRWIFTALWVGAGGAALGNDIPADLAAALSEFDRAQFSNDVATLERFLAADYLLVNSDASVENKEKALADFLQPGFKTEPYVLEQAARMVSTDAAVLAGLARLRWTQDGRQHARTVRIAYVWMKRDGRWQTTYTQVTRVPEP